MADWCIHRPGWDHGVIQEMVAELLAAGATFVRLTTFPDSPIVVLEGWRIEPDDQGPTPTVEDVIGFGR